MRLTYRSKVSKHPVIQEFYIYIYLYVYFLRNLEGSLLACAWWSVCILLSAKKSWLGPCFRLASNISQPDWIPIISWSKKRGPRHEITFRGTLGPNESHGSKYPEMTIPLSGATYANVTARFSSWSLDVHTYPYMSRSHKSRRAQGSGLSRSRLMPPRYYQPTTHPIQLRKWARSRPAKCSLSSSLSLSLQVSARKSRNTYTHIHTHTQRNNDGHRSTRNGSRGTQKSARCVQEVERSVDFLPMNFLIASLNSSDRRLLYFKHQLGQPPWFKVVTLTT